MSTPETTTQTTTQPASTDQSNPLSGIFNAIMPFLKMLGDILKSMFGNISSLFGKTDTATPETPSSSTPAQTNTATPNVQPTVTPVSQTTNVSAPATQPPPTTEQKTTAAKTEASALSYANKASKTEWLDPKDYEGRIKIPQKVIDEAKEEAKKDPTKKGVYALVAIKAGQREDGKPFVEGFHVFQDLKSGKQTLIPMMSGGDKAVAATNWKDTDHVEHTRYAPLPGLLTDGTAKGDGLNAKRKITEYRKNPYDSMIDGKPYHFQMFAELETGTNKRSAIGIHNDFVKSREGESKDSPWGSQGCPVMPESYIPEFQKQMQSLGIGKGSDYFILNKDETVSPSPTPKTAKTTLQRK